MTGKHHVDVMVTLPDGSEFKRDTIFVTDRKLEEIKTVIGNLEIFVRSLEDNCGGYIP